MRVLGKEGLIRREGCKWCEGNGCVFGVWFWILLAGSSIIHLGSLSFLHICNLSANAAE